MNDEVLTGEKMTGARRDRIRFEKTVFSQIRDAGYRAVDMHVHTCHSDAANDVSSILRHAARIGTGVAFTDHNECRAVREACASRSRVLVIPGIELSAAEGPHLLLYFYDPADLEDFFARHIRNHRRKCPYMALQQSVQVILDAAMGYSCIKVAAHPFGYFGINRGVLKCVENRTLSPDVMEGIDAVEVICGGMSRELNLRAAGYAALHEMPITGGSDAHVLPAVGGVVTCVRADTVEEFLKGVLRRESVVIGSPAGILHKGMTGAVIAWRYLPYTLSSLAVHYEQNLPRIRKSIREVLDGRPKYP